jgi:hypothetical protein
MQIRSTDFVAVHGKLGVKTRQPKVGLRRQEAALALAAAAVLKDEEPMDLEELEVGLQPCVLLFEIGKIRSFFFHKVVILTTSLRKFTISCQCSEIFLPKLFFFPKNPFKILSG